VNIFLAVFLIKKQLIRKNLTISMVHVLRVYKCINLILFWQSIGQLFIISTADNMVCVMAIGTQ